MSLLCFDVLQVCFVRLIHSSSSVWSGSAFIRLSYMKLCFNICDVEKSNIRTNSINIKCSNVHDPSFFISRSGNVFYRTWNPTQSHQKQYLNFPNVHVAPVSPKALFALIDFFGRRRFQTQFDPKNQRAPFPKSNWDNGASETRECLKVFDLRGFLQIWGRFGFISNKLSVLPDL